MINARDKTLAQEFAIEAYGLVKAFGKHRAVDDLSFCVPSGCIYAVLGPNGAGKTTTINILATLLRADAGVAKVFGYDVTQCPQIVRQLIGVTGQYASVDETLSATENLVIFSRLLGLGAQQAKQKARLLLEEFGLTEAATRPLSQFSGGMRRRLDLAASLIAEPPLVFLDEPTTGLDPRTRSQMWDTIRRLVRGGSTVLLTTQYLEEADQLASRIVVVDHGKVVAEGTPDELKKRVGTATLHLRLGDTMQLPAAEQIVEQHLGLRASRSPDIGTLTAPMNDADKVTDVLVGLRGAGVRVSEMSVQKPTLEEVFLTLTGPGAKVRRDRYD
jgi:ABC-2 type transport system ATP-binding protein